MTLASVQGIPPTQNGWREWLFNHHQDHLEIIQAIGLQQNTKLTVYDLWDMNPNVPTTWLEWHQQAHNDMNRVLQLEAQDLSSVDFKKKESIEGFIYQNFKEHQAAHDSLGI